MPQFITRVELHNANTPIDYFTLHLAMESEGFSRSVVFEDGVKYNLPPAEYYKFAYSSIEEIKQQAMKAASETKRTFSILVSEVINISAYNIVKSSD